MKTNSKSGCIRAEADAQEPGLRSRSEVCPEHTPRNHNVKGWEGRESFEIDALLEMTLGTRTLMLSRTWQIHERCVWFIDSKLHNFKEIKHALKEKKVLKKLVHERNAYSYQTRPAACRTFKRKKSLQAEKFLLSNMRCLGTYTFVKSIC